MEYLNLSNNKKGKMDNSKLKMIKSNYIIKKLFNNLQRLKALEIIKYNKNIQQRLNLNIKNYKDYSEKYSLIEIEITPNKNIFGIFINKEGSKYYHIYFNNKKEEISRCYLNEDDKVNKINIIIDYQVKSFYRLFIDCKCIESINFIKFYRNDINNMSFMFSCCSSLRDINLSNLKTNNVTDMCSIFSGCSSLKELNLSNFNTRNVTDMSCMFKGCSSLKKINLSNFNTNKVTDMCYMFDGCLSLEDTDISNFNTNNVTDMKCMFYGCLSLRDINLSNFKINNETNIIGMFSWCSDELNMKIRTQIKDIKDEAFKYDKIFH